MWKGRPQGRFSKWSIGSKRGKVIFARRARVWGNCDLSLKKQFSPPFLFAPRPDNGRGCAWLCAHLTTFSSPQICPARNELHSPTSHVLRLRQKTCTAPFPNFVLGNKYDTILLSHTPACLEFTTSPSYKVSVFSFLHALHIGLHSCVTNGA